MKENAKEGRIYALFGKAFLLFAAALVMLCINPLTAHAAIYGSVEEDEWLLNTTSGELTIYSDDGMWSWSQQASNGYKNDVKNVTVGENVTAIEGYQDDDASRPFSGCKNLKTITLPSSLKTIEHRSFYGCESLESIVIPGSVTSIGAEAFSGCSKLASVTMEGGTPPTLGGGNVFSGTALSTAKDSENKIYVPTDNIADYKNDWTDWADYIYDGSGGGDEEDPEKPDPEKPDPEDPENPNPEDPEDPGRNLDIDPTAEDYADTAIEVLGFTANGTVYSVDVEWGAMTFWYENTTWDATAHKTVPGAGWKVYDSEKNKALDTKTDAINRIQVTNHSNEDVWATLAYTGESKYADDTSGSFDTDENDVDTVYNKTGKWLSLGTADNGVGDAAGTPTVGTVYFMPKGIKEEYKTDGIAKWSQLGTITVGIVTEEPKN